MEAAESSEVRPYPSGLQCALPSSYGVDFPFNFDKTGNVETKSALAALAALAQDTRLSIFRLLVEQGPQGLPAGEIVERLAVPNATASFHLKELAQANLVTPRQAGRFVFYSANYTTMNGLVAYLTENCCKAAACDIACAPVVAKQKRRMR